MYQNLQNVAQILQTVTVVLETDGNNMKTRLWNALVM